MNPSPPFSFSKRCGGTLAGLGGLAVGSVLLLCGAGYVPIENFLPQGPMQADLNAGGCNITNAASVGATGFVGDGSQLTGVVLTGSAAVIDSLDSDGGAFTSDGSGDVTIQQNLGVDGSIQGVADRAIGDANGNDVRYTYQNVYNDAGILQVNDYPLNGYLAEGGAVYYAYEAAADDNGNNIRGTYVTLTDLYDSGFSTYNFSGDENEVTLGDGSYQDTDQLNVYSAIADSFGNTLDFSQSGISTLIDSGTSSQVRDGTGAFHAMAGLPVAASAPVSSSSTGTPGEIAYDAGYLYVCVASNSWKRVALSSY